MIHYDDIVSYFKDFYNKKLPDLVERNKLLETGELISIIGARKVGKTYLCFQKMKSLIKSGVKKSQILRLNFEIYPLYLIKAHEFEKLLEIYWSIFPEEKNLYIFIDEPQGIDNWEKGILTLYEKFRYPIFITGSSSKLLSKEIASAFRGLGVKFKFFTLSFIEFLKFNNFKPSLDLSTNEKGQMLKFQRDFLEFGGYPKVVLENQIFNKITILNEYLDSVILRDIIERFNIRNDIIMRTFIPILMKQIGQICSINKIHQDFKSRNIKVTKKTLYSYLMYLEDAMILFRLKKYHSKFKERNLSSFSKVYVHDLGLATLFSQKNPGRRLENAVFMELLRIKANYNPLWEICYFTHSGSNKEIDFLVIDREDIIMAIQVSYDFSNTKTWERELSSLLEGLHKLNLEKGFIITNNTEKELKKNGKKIFFIPFWKWLLKIDKKNYIFL